MTSEGQTTDTAINSVCPWSGKPVSADSLTNYKDVTVGFCNPGCRDKFEAAIQCFDTAIKAVSAKPSA